MARMLGRALLVTAPLLMKTLSVLGTVAMFLVGGGIVLHGIPHAHHVLEPLRNSLGNSPGLPFLVQSSIELTTGLVAGTIVLLLVNFAKRFKKPAPHTAS
jgi:predicted DNA repair protein MutK